MLCPRLDLSSAGRKMQGSKIVGILINKTNPSSRSKKNSICQLTDNLWIRCRRRKSEKFGDPWDLDHWYSRSKEGTMRFAARKNRNLIISWITVFAIARIRFFPSLFSLLSIDTRRSFFPPLEFLSRGRRDKNVRPYGGQLGINSIYRAAKSRNRISRKEGRGLKMMGARGRKVSIIV